MEIFDALMQGFATAITPQNLMLMMVDHHVHYHVIPRYASVRTFAGREWVDNGWPAVPVIADNQHQDDPGILHLIQEKLKPGIV